jgi:tetratricopeptide (TPR) repeat protein
VEPHSRKPHRYMTRTSEQEQTRKPRRAVVAALLTIVVLATAGAVATGCSNSISEAQKAEEAGDLTVASSLYQKQLDAHPNDLRAVKGLAGILYVERRWNEALPLQEKAVAMDPKEARIRVELGFNYLNHQSAAAKAVTVLEEATVLEHTAQHLGFLAQAQMAAGSSQLAEASLREAMGVDKTYVRAYDLLVTLLEQQGRKADAAAVRSAARDAGLALQSGSSSPSAT